MHEYRFGSSTSYPWFGSWERFGSSISYLSLIWIISHCIWNDVPRYSYSSLGTKFPERALRPCSTFEADKAQTSQSICHLQSPGTQRRSSNRVRAPWKTLGDIQRIDFNWGGEQNTLSDNYLKFRGQNNIMAIQVPTSKALNTHLNGGIRVKEGCTTKDQGKERSKSMILQCWPSLQRMCDNMPLQWRKWSQSELEYNGEQQPNLEYLKEHDQLPQASSFTNCKTKLERQANDSSWKLT